MHVETKNLKINTYLKERTGYDIDIFKSYFERINKVLEKGRITTDNQYYDIKIMVDWLYDTEEPDIKKIDQLNGLLAAYEIKKPLKISR